MRQADVRKGGVSDKGSNDESPTMRKTQLLPHAQTREEGEREACNVQRSG